MRVFFGMILGAALTVSGAFLYDTWATPRPSTTGTATNAFEQRPMVNWEVVGENWRVVSQRAREAWTALAQKVTS